MSLSEVMSPIVCTRQANLALMRDRLHALEQLIVQAHRPCNPAGFKDRCPTCIAKQQLKAMARVLEEKR